MSIVHFIDTFIDELLILRVKVQKNPKKSWLLKNI